MDTGHESGWERIRRARLVQIVGVYVGISFGILQAVDIFANRLPIPEWTFVATFVLLLIGLPVVTATALLQSRSKEARGSWLTWGRTLRGGLAGAAGLALLVVGISVLGVLGMGPASSLIARGVMDARDRILIAEFTSPTGDAALAGALTEAFRVDFEQSPVVTLVPMPFVRDALVRMGRDPAAELDPATARELAEREGIKAVVVGEVGAVGRSFVVTGRLLSASDGEVLASHRESADSANLIAAVDQVSKTLRKQIGESLRSLRANDPLEQVSTPSLEALRRYSQAVRAAEMERDHDRAMNLLEEAIRLDPAFAMAHRKLAVVLLNRGGSNERVEAALRNAYEHRDRLTDRERYITLGTYYRHAEYDDDRAMAAYRTLLDLHPDETAALNNLAIIYGNQGDHERAEELYRRALAIDTLGAMYHTNLISQLIAQGKLVAADSILATYSRRFPDHPEAHLTASAIAVNRGEYGRAGEALQTVAEDRSVPAFSRAVALLDLANLDLLHGRPEAALQRVAQAAPMLPAMAGLDTIYGLEIARAFGEAVLVGDVAAATARVDDALARRPLADLPASDRPYASLIAFYAEVGQPDRVRAYYEQALAGPEAASPAFRSLEQAFWRAHLAMAEDRPMDAVGALRTVAEDGACPGCVLPFMARAFVRAAQPDSAIAAYDRYLAATWHGRLATDALELPRAHLALADLYEQRDDRQRAAHHHAAFLDLWREAEPPLQGRVRYAEDALRRLMAEGR